MQSCSQYMSTLCFRAAAEFCKKIKTERAQMQDEAEVLRQEIESLNSAIR